MTPLDIYIKAVARREQIIFNLLGFGIKKDMAITSAITESGTLDMIHDYHNIINIIYKTYTTLER